MNNQNKLLHSRKIDILVFSLDCLEIGHELI